LHGADPEEFFGFNSEAPDLASRVVGRINRPEFFAFWRDVVRAPPFVLDWIRHGYRLDFKNAAPPPSFERNNSSARDPQHFDFLDQEIADLLRAGALREVPSRPYIVLPMQVAVQPSKKRLIVDASRAINPTLTDGHVRLPTLARVAPEVPQGAWLCTLDLKSGYYHWRVREQDRRYLGVAWTGRDGRQRFYEWTVTFLGLSTLVRDFTKVLRPVVAYLRRIGVHTSVYIDDFVIVSATREQAFRDRDKVLAVLSACGWVDNPDKRQGPAQRLKYLGLILDTRTRTVHIPPRKLDKLRDTLSRAGQTPRATVRDLARVTGLVISVLQATGPTLLLLSRPLFATIAQAASYNQWVSWVPLHSAFLDLAAELPRLDGAPVFRDDDEHIAASTHLASDASANGLAVCRILCRAGREHIWHHGPCGVQWFREPITGLTAGLSSTLRELLAILRFLCHHGFQLTGRRVTNWTDSNNTERILLRGSPVPDLQRLALAIHFLARHYRIDLRVFWIRRSDPRIQLADEHSRFEEPEDPDDFGLCKNDFFQLQAASGRPFTCDLFASQRNARCARFASITAAPGATFRDAFAVHWGQQGFIYLHPPPHLVAPSVRKLVRDRATGVLIVPRWYTLPGWHVVCQDGAHVNGWASRVRRFQARYSAGPSVRSPTFAGVPTFPTLAIWFAPSTSPPFSSVVSPLFCVDDACSRCT